MTDPATTNGPIRIDAGDDARRTIVLKPEDNDLFVRTARQVIDHCQLGISLELWLKELDSLSEAVAAWCVTQGGVRSCYCTPQGARVVFFMSPARNQFDFDLADALAEFSLQQAPHFNVGHVDFHQVPLDELDRFLNIRNAKWVYGEPFEAHRAMET